MVTRSMTICWFSLLLKELFDNNDYHLIIIVCINRLLLVFGAALPKTVKQKQSDTTSG